MFKGIQAVNAASSVMESAQEQIFKKYQDEVEVEHILPREVNAIARGHWQSAAHEVALRALAMGPGTEGFSQRFDTLVQFFLKEEIPHRVKSSLHRKKRPRQ